MCAYILDCVHACVRLCVILCECDRDFLACAYFCVAESLLDMYFVPGKFFMKICLVFTCAGITDGKRSATLNKRGAEPTYWGCLLYTSDAADES